MGRTRVRELPKLGAHLVISGLISVFVAMLLRADGTVLDGVLDDLFAGLHR